MSKSYRLKCRNPKCGQDFLRYWPKEEFDKLQYGGEGKGIGCFSCGFPKMIIIKSNRSANDGFKAGWQSNIRKHCSTYSEYKAHLKNMGLVELGYEDLGQTQNLKREYFSDDIVKKLNQKYGLSLTESDVQKIRRE